MRRAEPVEVNEMGMGTYVFVDDAAMEPASELEVSECSPESFADEPHDQPTPDEQLQDHSQVRRPRREARPEVSRRRRLPRAGTMFKIGLAGLAFYGGFSIWQGLFDDGGSHFDAEADVEETRVYLYDNAPLELAGIESDLDLSIDAGWDRTNLGPVKIPGVDLSPINNDYTFRQNNLTTSTQAILTAESMRVESDSTETVVTLGGEFSLSKTHIDWLEEDLAGADITGSSMSFGNELKDQIDNDALEILQASGGVAAACAMRDTEIQPLLTEGVIGFLKVVKPELVREGKKLRVVIDDMEQQAESEYIDAVDQLNNVVSDIESDYSEEADTFKVDVTGILDCARQNIRVVKDKE